MGLLSFEKHYEFTGKRMTTGLHDFLLDYPNKINTEDPDIGTLDFIVHEFSVAGVSFDSIEYRMYKEDRPASNVIINYYSIGELADGGDMHVALRFHSHRSKNSLSFDIGFMNIPRRSSITKDILNNGAARIRTYLKPYGFKG